MREVVFCLILIFSALIVQTTVMMFFIPPEYRPDLMLIVIVWCGYRLSFITGAPAAFGTGLLVDLFSGSPTGLFSTMYCLFILLLGYLDSRFHLDSIPAKAVMILGATLVTGFMVFALRRASAPVEFGAHALEWITIRSIITAGIAVPVLSFLDTAWSGYSRLVGAS
ncbi:rod shape-determining protein MreD [Desulfomonile tiedjei]|uniref:Rod shape-determining protein MreD n=1 Tax=Desulfomonile tiedjei (strain ATCC 49306 / DSM 6799 / DCB-1) TaxID=706587 RepID=I4C9W9_DESTA|nr:rod shape-determining protein MreD [Desulfomonile tiedjei]AFM26360.1 rod shape-determining protein MreD [Desulfomonile tiedjei DSM 6799]